MKPQRRVLTKIILSSRHLKISNQISKSLISQKISTSQTSDHRSRFLSEMILKNFLIFQRQFPILKNKHQQAIISLPQKLQLEQQILLPKPQLVALILPKHKQVQSVKTKQQIPLKAVVLLPIKLQKILKVPLKILRKIKPQNTSFKQANGKIFKNF